MQQNKNETQKKNLRTFFFPKPMKPDEEGSGTWEVQQKRPGRSQRRPREPTNEQAATYASRYRTYASEPEHDNWRAKELDPSGKSSRRKLIGNALTPEQKEAQKEKPPCRFESQYETLTCLDLDCWNSKQFQHRRQRPQDCRWGGDCRSYRCLRLHPLVAWKQTIEEVKRQAQLRYRDKDQEMQDEWDGRAQEAEKERREAENEMIDPRIETEEQPEAQKQTQSDAPDSWT